MGILNTFRGGFEQMRDGDVLTDETLIDGSTTGYTYRFEDKPSHAMQLGTEYNGAQIFFSAGQGFGQGLHDTSAVAGKQCNFSLYGWPSNGPGMNICDGTVQAGGGQIFPVAEGHDGSESLGCFSIDITDHWPTSITVAPNDMTNTMTTLTLDLAGIEHIAVLFGDVSFPINAHIRPY
jgi:hypothetical protein